MEQHNSHPHESNVQVSDKKEDLHDAADPGYGFVLDDQMKEELARASEAIVRPESHIPNLLESPKKKDEHESKPSAPEFEGFDRPEKVGQSTEAERESGEERAEKQVETGTLESEKGEDIDEEVREEDLQKEDEEKQPEKPEKRTEMEQPETFQDSTTEKREPFEDTEPEFEKQESFPVVESKNEEVKHDEEAKTEDVAKPDEQGLKAEEVEEPKQTKEEEKEVPKKEPQTDKPAEEQPRLYEFLQGTPSETVIESVAETSTPVLEEIEDVFKKEEKPQVESANVFQTPASEEKSKKQKRSVESNEKPEARPSHYFSLGSLLEPSRFHPLVADLLYWRDPKKSGAALGTILALLLSLKFLSLISVVSYAALAALAITLSFRVYKSVMQAVQKTQDGHPFKEYLEMDVTVPAEKVHETADVLAGRVNSALLELRRLFLVEDLVDSLKFGLVLWLLTYLGAWFNGLTLVIFGAIGLFTLPKVYETHQDKIDQNLDLVRSKINEITEKVQAVLPIGKKPKSQ